MGFPVVPNMSAMRIIGSVLRNSCVKCYVVFIERLQNVLNNNINEK